MKPKFETIEGVELKRLQHCVTVAARQFAEDAKLFQQAGHNLADAHQVEKKMTSRRVGNETKTTVPVQLITQTGARQMAELFAQYAEEAAALEERLEDVPRLLIPVDDE